MPTLRTLLLCASIGLTGCSTLHLSSYTQQKDPFEPLNRKMYGLNDTLDRALVKPLAQGYAKVTPQPIKTVVNNFFSNLDDVTVTLNDLLQLKFRQAASDGSRVLFNSTFGLGGLLDVTQRLEKHHEDFGQTLGYWGCPSGPYLFLPGIGPSSVRDGTGLYADSFASAIGNVSHVPTRNTAWLARSFNARVNLLDQEQVMDDATVDRYSFIRDAYLMHRQSLVYDGNPPRIRYEEEDEDAEP
ncbi:MAG: VacJ family lipoprotein [Sideroxydans sp.]